MDLYSSPPDGLEGKAVLIFGRPNSGKTSLRNAIAGRHPGIASLCIDDFRRIHGDGTLEGEMRAQETFTDARVRGGGLFESSGAGIWTWICLDRLRGKGARVIILDVPDEVCISRIDLHKYGGVPFPFDTDAEDFIRNVGRCLSPDHVEVMCQGSEVLRIDGLSPFEEQVALAERFLGLDVTNGTSENRQPQDNSISRNPKERRPFHNVITLDEVGYRNSIYCLAVPIDVHVDYDGEKHAVYNEEVYCMGEGASMDEAMNDFSSAFVGMVEMAGKYGRKSNDGLDRVMYHVEGRR